jgi:hypothetical protein
MDVDDDGVGVERRGKERVAMGERAAVRIRPGHHARLRDLSSTGARIETTCRLLPNSSIELRFDIGRRRSFSRASVVRSSVCRLDGAGPVYESAVRFQEPLGGVDQLQGND